MSKTNLVLFLTNKSEKKVHIPNLQLKQIKWIKHRPTGQPRPETGEFIAKCLNCELNCVCFYLFYCST